uniref:Putative secreted protein n=1 Tax=Ixodes ricinus TaxID=34613 RepID=A0A6B0U144_IXORI
MLADRACACIAFYLCVLECDQQDWYSEQRLEGTSCISTPYCRSAVSLCTLDLEPEDIRGCRNLSCSPL